MGESPVIGDAPSNAGPSRAEVDRLRSLALLDELTGLANRRAFLERLQEASAGAQAGGPPFILALMDLDGLKDINDTFGYTAGDHALREFATALAQVAGPDALTARIGGDEFAVVAPCATPNEARERAERLRDVAQGVVRPLKDGAPDVILSASFGESIWGPSAESAAAVFTAAEATMAAAKAAPPPVAVPDAFRPRGRRALGEELRSLLAMARQVSSSSGMNDLLRRVIEQAAALVGAESAAIALVTDEGVVRLEEVWRHGGWHPFPSTRPLGEGVLGRTAASGQPELHNTVTRELTHDWPGVMALGLRAMLAVPLRDGAGATFGVLTLGNKRGRQPFQEADIGLTQAFADLAASAIENVRASAATEEARAYQWALMEQARDAILVADPVSGRLTDANEATERLTGYRRDELQTLTLRSLELDPAALAGVAVDPSLASLVALREGLRRKDGERIPVELSASHVQTARGSLLLVIVRDIRERLAAEAETRRRNEELEARNTVAALLAESRRSDAAPHDRRTSSGDAGDRPAELTAALRRVLPIIARACEMDGAMVMLADEGGYLRPVAGYNVPPGLERLMSEAPPRLGERFAGGALATRTPVVVDDARSDPRLTLLLPRPLNEEAHNSLIASFAMLPLVSDERRLGVLAAGSREPGSLDDRRLARLRAFADQIAVWLDSRLHLEDAQMRGEDARFLADLGESLNETRDEGEIVRRLADGVAARFGSGAVIILREAGNRWRPAASAGVPDPVLPSLAEMARGLALQSGQGAESAWQRPWLVDLDEPVAPDTLSGLPALELARGFGLACLLSVPLSAGGELLGLLLAGNRHGQPLLKARHLALAQEVAQHAALALTNARAYAASAASQGFLRAMMAQAGEAILVFDATGKVSEANAASEALTGRERASLIGLQPDDLLLPRDAARLTRVVERLLAARRGRARPLVRVRRADGRVLTAQVNASCVAAGELAVIALLRDVTDERAAARQRERLLSRVREEAERSGQLLELAGRLAGSEGPQAVLRIALDACGKLAKVGRAGMFLWDEERGAFVYGASTGVTEEERAFLERYVIDESKPSHAPLLGLMETRLTCDVRLHPDASPDFHEGFGAAAVVTTPLRAGGALLGFLAAEHVERTKLLAPRDRAMLTGIAQQTATALVAVDARRRIEEGLDYLQAIMQRAGDGIVVIDLATNLIVDANERLAALLGYGREDLIGLSAQSVVIAEERADAAANLDAIRAGVGAREVTRRHLLHRDGDTIPVEVSISRVTVGSRNYSVGIAHDLRGRIAAEERLQLHAQVLANLVDAVIVLDREGRVMVWNRGAEVLFGWSAEEMAGIAARDAITEGGLPYLNDLVRRLGTVKQVSGDVPFTRKDGTRMLCDVVLTRLEDEHGEQIGLIGIARDVTARREIEARLDASAKLVDTVSEAIGVLDMAGIVQYANRAAHELLGYPEGELIGRRVDELLAEGSAAELRSIATATLTGGWSGRLHIRRADGSHMDFQGDVSPLIGEHGRPVGIAVREGGADEPTLPPRHSEVRDH